MLGAFLIELVSEANNGFVLNQNSKNKLHESFKQIYQDNTYAPVREVIQSWGRGLLERSGEQTKFVKEFQTTFNSALWELYLNEMFIRLDYSVDYTKDSPDFCVTTPSGYQFNVEAVISDRPHNPPAGALLANQNSNINQR